MADVFISYSRPDRERAAMLAAALERNTLSVWWDKDLPVADDYRSKITTELDEAGCVIVLWSARSVAPENFVLSEASRAKKRGTLLPVRIERVALPIGFDQLHCVDLCSWAGEDSNEEFRVLLRALSMRLRRGFKSLLPEKRALLIAVDGYARADDFRLDTAPFADGEALARALNTADGAGFKVTLKRNLDSLQLRRCVQELATQATANDLVLLYFAGHARLSTDDGLCLCAADTQPDQLDSTALPLSTLARYLNKIAAEQVIVLLDCDFSVAPSRNMDGSIEGALAEALGRGKGRHLIAANLAPLNGPPVNRSAFVRALAAGLDSFAADSQQDNVITLDEWFEYARLAAQTAGAPEPGKWAFGVAPGSVEIARRAAPVRPPTPTRAPSRPEAIDSTFLDKVESRLRCDRIIPLLGDGIYGSGPLSCFEIVGELAGRTRAFKPGDMQPLATVAEYCLETDDRDQFLGELRGILADHASRCEPKLVHDFVLGLRRPWLVISTTYDWFLEDRLAQAGVRFMVVAHVLRSREARHDGRIAVVRYGSEPRYQTCLADELLPDERNDCVIYKMLGSPFLHDFAPAEDQIDTVVVTETDHATFLSRLENQAMSVPTAFARPLQTRHLLYLGYNLDIWHYRLVSHVFSKDGPARIEKEPFAVRVPTSGVERSFWKRLGVYLAEVDAESFAKAIMEGSSA